MKNHTKWFWVLLGICIIFLFSSLTISSAGELPDENHAPEICRAWADPYLKEAGQAVTLNVTAKDWDGIDDVVSVTVDMAPIGGDIVKLEPVWNLVDDDRRCLGFAAKTAIPPLAPYGLHGLPVSVVDQANASDTAVLELFVVTSWVEIEFARADPNPVAVGHKTILSARVSLIAPKNEQYVDPQPPFNRIEKVTVDITELLGVDCGPDMDCIIIEEMTNPDGDGIYTHGVPDVTGGPGSYQLPVVAVDSLGHEDKALIEVKVVEKPIGPGDVDANGALDMKDALLALQAASGMAISHPVFTAGDVDKDLRIGLAEAVFDLQWAAGFRPDEFASIQVAASDNSRNLTPDASPAELQTLVDGNTGFALEFYHAVCKSSDNLFFSPLSISQALAMTSAGARGNTLQQMTDTLYFIQSQERLHMAFNALDLELARRGQDAQGQDGQGFRLNISNATWGQQGYAFLPEFLGVLSENYGAGMYLMDFMTAPEDSRLVINNWVADRTEEKIQNLLSPGSISGATRLVLTNAVYFNAAWAMPFDADLSRPESFYLTDGTIVSVGTMSQTVFYKCALEDDYRAVELLYDGLELSMVIVMPDTGRFRSFEDQLNPAYLASVLEGLENRNVHLQIPAFGFASGSVSLSRTLFEMGMPDAFGPVADFSGMDGTRNLFLSDVVHKAFINVDEVGTEAAAATAAVVSLTSVPEAPVVMKIDRPFVFFIRDIPTGTILFMGRVMNPA